MRRGFCHTTAFHVIIKTTPTISIQVCGLVIPQSRPWLVCEEAKESEYTRHVLLFLHALLSKLHPHDLSSSFL